MNEKSVAVDQTADEDEVHHMTGIVRTVKAAKFTIRQRIRQLFCWHWCRERLGTFDEPTWKKGARQTQVGEFASLVPKVEVYQCTLCGFVDLEEVFWQTMTERFERRLERMGGKKHGR